MSPYATHDDVTATFLVLSYLEFIYNSLMSSLTSGGWGASEVLEEECFTG